MKFPPAACWERAGQTLVENSDGLTGPPWSQHPGERLTPSRAGGRGCLTLQVS